MSHAPADGAIEGTALQRACLRLLFVIVLLVFVAGVPGPGMLPGGVAAAGHPDDTASPHEAREAFDVPGDRAAFDALETRDAFDALEAGGTPGARGDVPGAHPAARELPPDAAVPPAGPGTARR